MLQRTADGCKMMYISTDYVFDGQGTAPWEPDCKDYAPLNVYGETKLEGELAVSDLLEKYFHCPYCLGIRQKRQKFYQDHAEVWAKTHDQLKVVNDQIGTPTYTFLDFWPCSLVDMDQKQRNTADYQASSGTQGGRLYQLVRFHKRNLPPGDCSLGTQNIRRKSIPLNL